MNRKTVEAALRLLENAGLPPPDRGQLTPATCLADDPAFEWCRPQIAHIAWSLPPVIRRVLRWVENIRHGKPDLRQTLIAAHFVNGGTITAPIERRS